MSTVRFLQGGGYATAGILLLLYTFGILEYGVKFMLIFVGFVLIAYGLYLMGVHNLIRTYTAKKSPMSAFQTDKDQKAQQSDQTSHLQDQEQDKES